MGGASRSLYEEMLIAGVKVYEFQPGLLHTKSITVDRRMTLIGSANMDRRSFDLNYENNILLADPALTQAMRDRQDSYLARSRPVTLDGCPGNGRSRAGFGTTGWRLPARCCTGRL